MIALTLEVAMEIKHQLQSQLDRADRPQAAGRAGPYKAELARQRFMQVDPNNHLVAATSEAGMEYEDRALDEFPTNSVISSDKPTVPCSMKNNVKKITLS